MEQAQARRDIAATREDLRRVEQELAKRPTHRQFWLVAACAILAVVVVLVAAILVILDINGSANQRADKAEAAAARLEHRVDALIDQNKALHDNQAELKRIALTIDKATDECVQARSARNTSRILAYADDLIRESHGQPKRPHPSLPPLPDGCDEPAVIAPPG